MELKTPSEIAAQVKAAVDGNVPRVIDARNRYEPQKEVMSEAERATMIENIRRSINHENPRVVDARNRYEPQTFTMSEDERKALSDHIWQSINHELPRNYDVRNQGNASGEADTAKNENAEVKQTGVDLGTKTNYTVDGESSVKKDGAASNVTNRQHNLPNALRKGDIKGLASASLRFVSNRDQFYRNMEKVPPLEGYEDVACHADAYSFGFTDPVTGETVQEADAKFLALRIRESGKYKGGPIRLIACESGALEDGLAQQFANEMGVEVLAPTKKAYTDGDGYMVLADDDLEADLILSSQSEKWNPKGWVIYKPKRSE